MDRVKNDRNVVVKTTMLMSSGSASVSVATKTVVMAVGMADSMIITFPMIPSILSTYRIARTMRGLKRV